MEQPDYLITLKPKNELLQKQVAYYYFHVSHSEEYNKTFFFYPNYLHALTIYQGSEITIDMQGKSSRIKPALDASGFTLIYSINLNDKMQVFMEGAFYKIGIVFYPLGFNHFIDHPLNQLMSQPFQEIVLSEKFNRHLSPLCKSMPPAQQLDIIEQALLSVWRPFKEDFLHRAIRDIVLSNGTIKVDELEKRSAFSRKTLLRLFKKHTFASIESYKKMVMFRNSLNYAVQQQELVNLTDIALYTMYYDQSHYIKHFKSITKETPKTLLPKIVQIGNEELYWHFLED
ncbi:helix-turn-helix domain-containing protein [Flavobacterium sp. JP2137]|uniref:helix-turn-helix domain-containing protein n=1 Tax=Flavobacterium sp. JP2137 TaxID=3414510 RepID=UPI003D301425